MCNLYTQSKSPDEIARLFRDLRLAESEQIAALMAGLQGRLSAVDLAALGARVG